MSAIKNQNKTNLPTYFSRKEAEINIDLNDYVLFAKDKNSTDARKQFSRLPVSQFNDIEELLILNRNLYEILPPNFPVKPYFDLEMEYSGLSYETSKDFTEKFINWIIIEIKKQFDVELVRSDFIALDSCRENKLSFHLIIQNKIYFANVLEHKIFILYLWSRFTIPNNEEETNLFETLSWMYGDVDKRRIFDPLPYGSYQNFRLVNQSKKGKPYILKNTTEYSNIDTLVRLYTGVGDRKKIDVNILRDKIEKTNGKKKERKIGEKNEKKTANIQNYIEDITFIKEGETLMKKNNITYADVEKLPEYLQYLYLIPNTVQSYVFCRNVAFAIRGSGGKKIDLIEWIALYKKHEEKREKKGNGKAVLEGFDSYNSGKKGETNTYSIPFLKKYAELANPEYFKPKWQGGEVNFNEKSESDILLEKYFNPNFENIRIIVEDCPFVSQKGTIHEKNILAPEIIIILQAYLGKGKTTAIKRLLSKYKRILLLSPRIAFSKFLCEDFGAICYLDVDEEMKKNNKLDKLVMSMEGLHKLKGIEYYDCIIFDECEDNLGVFASPTMKRKQVETYEVFCHLIKNCKKFIMASAFITDKTLNFARSLKMPVCLIRNTSLPPKQIATEINVGLFNLKLYESLKKGDKNYVVWCSLTAMKGFMNELEGGSRENEKLKEINQRKLIYSSEVDDSQFNTLNEIEKKWGDAPLVMTTPSITVGNSYSTKDFTSVWIHGAPTCIVPQTFQGHMRVRHLKENTMNFCLPMESMLRFHKSRTEIKFTMLSQYDSMTDQKLKVMVDLVKKLSKDKNESNNHSLEIIERSLTTEYEITPEPLRELLMFNLLEQALSQKYYKEMFFQFLKICNYDIRGISRISNEAEELAAGILTENKVLNPIKYSEIEKIGWETAEEIQKIKEKKNATSIQKLQLRRYHFDRKINLSLPLDVVEFYFGLDEFSYNKTRLNNAYFEATKTQKDIEEDVIYNTKKTGAELGLHLIYPKLQYIREINEKLGLVNSSIRDITISRNKMEEISEYILAERKALHTLFNLKDKSVEINEKNTVKRNLELLNKIYGAWSGMKIAAKENNNKGKVNEFLTTLSYGLLVPPPPYEITYNKIVTGECLIKMDEPIDVPYATAQELPALAIAEPFNLLEMDLLEEIPEAVEILIPSKWGSCDYLENERLGLSQSQPPIIWKKRIPFH